MTRCRVCGREVDEPPPDWSSERGEHGETRHLCPACTRDAVRAIEARLRPEWW